MGVRSGELEQLGDKQKLPAFSLVLEYGLIALSLLGSIGILVWLLFFSRYGYDFTDEGFYLTWLSTPDLYSWSLSQFGFLYHPFYILFDGDIRQLRILNVLVTYFLGWFLVDNVLKDIFLNDIKGRIARVSSSFGFATAVFVFFSVWVLSPSYNGLNYQALLIVAIGLLMAQSSVDKKSIIGWLLIGIGGWLAFMAKPSSAAALGVCVFFCLLFSKKINRRLIFLCGTTVVVLVVLSALLIDGSLQVFIARLQLAMSFASYLGGGHSLRQIIRIDSFSITREDFMIYLMALSYCFALAIALSVNNKLSRWFGLFFAFSGFGLLLVMLAGKYLVSLEAGSFHVLLISIVPVSAFLLVLFQRKRELFDHFSRSRLFLAFALMLFPHIFAFGTNNNYWQVGGLAGFFWLVGMLVLLAPSIRGVNSTFFCFPLVIVTQLIVVLLLQVAIESPYRQTQSLRLNSSAVQVGRPGSNLVLSEGYANYLSESSKALRKAGFQPSTPVIDLSGQSPGLLYSLGAKNIGQAWMIGGYPGSVKLATEALKRVSCNELADAWLLIEPGGPRNLPDSLVISYGAKPSDYEVVAIWDTADGAGGFERRPPQSMLKPVRNRQLSIDECNEIRR